MSITVNTQPTIIYDTIAERDAATYLPDGVECFLKDTNCSYMKKTGSWVNTTGGGGSPAWGSITGTLSAQTDLQTELSKRLSVWIGDTAPNPTEYPLWIDTS